MDISQIGAYLDVIFKVSMAAFGIWLFFDRRDDKTNNRIDEHSERLIKIETQLSQQPTHDHLADVYREIRKVSGELASISNSLSAVGATLDAVKERTSRMDSFLLNNQPRS